MDDLSVLVASTCQDDLAWFEVVLRETGWQFHCVHSVADAVAFIRRQRTVVVVSEPDLPGGSWKQLLSQLVEEGHPSALVVFSHLADERLWSEVLHLGGYDVLPKPFDKGDVSRTLALAWQQCKHRCRAAIQRPVTDHLVVDTEALSTARHDYLVKVFAAGNVSAD
jgi:FixJ family two-component response regulator